MDRLSPLDASFLQLEDGGAHMHVASVLIFEGATPTLEELTAHLVSRLDLVPRYRQRLAQAPFGQGRPVWVDDPHFNPGYHIRHTALPRPGDDDSLRRLAGRLFSQRLDRTKPLWEIWLVEGLASNHFALIAKTHHALIDGISGVDVTSVLFDSEPDASAPRRRRARKWTPRPLPTNAELLADAVLERANLPKEALRIVRDVLETPTKAIARAIAGVENVGAFALAGATHPAPPSPFNVPIGPHRRFTWVDADLEEFRHIKNVLGGTVNDVVLAAVSGALGRYLRAEGVDTTGLVLKAMVPVSVRADPKRGALGNQVAAMWAPLPVGIEDPRAALLEISEAMVGLKESGQAVGAQVLTEIAGFAPSTIISQAARLQARQRYFNLVVTNVPGPQTPLYLLGRRLESIYPVVPLAAQQALGIAIISYAGKLGFGLLADYDALPALELIAVELEREIAALMSLAGPLRPRPTRRRPKSRGPLKSTSDANASGNGSAPGHRRGRSAPAAE